MGDKIKNIFLKFSIFQIVFFCLAISVIAIFATTALSLETNKLDDKQSNDVIELDAYKTADWDSDNCISGEINILADANANVLKIPNILFIGTLCGAHGLTAQTIENSLNASASAGNVDYFFCNNNNPNITGFPGDFSGHIDKDQTIVDENIEWFKNNSMRTANHQAMGKFYKCLYDNIVDSGKHYDFIVMEFDGTRIADWYRNLHPIGDPDGALDSDDYYKFEHEEDVVEALKPFYDNHAVMWITDQAVNPEDSSTLYRPSEVFQARNISGLLLRRINYNSLKGLLSPYDYKETPDAPDSDPSYFAEIESTILTEDDDLPVSDDHILSFDRQTGYRSSSDVAQFLKEGIESIYKYDISITDVIHIEQNLVVNPDTMVLYTSKTGEEGTWVALDKSEYIFSYEENIGKVYVRVNDLNYRNCFKLVIPYKDKSQTERFIDVSEDGIPNNGPAIIDVMPKAGQKKQVDPKIPKEEALDWKVNINYKKNPLNGGDITSNGETLTANSEKSVANGCVATPRDGYIFTGWTNDKGELVETNNKLMPLKNSKDRYMQATYTANFVIARNVDYDIEGDPVYGTPTDSVLPDSQIVKDGTQNYNLAEFPTTSWTTSNGRDDGLIGEWRFYGWSYDYYDYDNLVTQIPLVKKDYTMYGKWVFSPEMSIVKNVNYTEDAQPAIAGNVIHYSIDVSNNTSKAVDNVVVKDFIPEGLIFDAVFDDGVYDDSSNMVYWDLGSFSAFSSLTLNFDAQVPIDLDSPVLYRNTAYVYVDDVETFTSNTVVSRANPLFADIEVVKSWIDGSDKHLNDTIKFNLYKYSISDPVSFQTYTMSSASTSGKWSMLIEDLPIYDIDGNFYTYNVKELDNNDNPVEDNSKLFVGEKQYTSTYTYQYSLIGDNYTKATITNTPCVDNNNIEVDVNTDKESVKPGDEITYDIDITNNSEGGTATDVEVIEIIPSGLDIVDPDGGEVTEKEDGSKEIKWIIDEIDPGETVDIVVVVVVPEDAEEPSYQSDVEVINYDDPIPEQKESPEYIINPPRKGTAGVGITKSIVKEDEFGEHEYIFSVNKPGDKIDLRYRLFVYEADKMDDATVTNTFSSYLAPDTDFPGYDASEWQLNSDGTYTFTRSLLNVVKGVNNVFDIGLVVDGSIDKSISFESPSKLDAHVTIDSEPQLCSAYSNETEVYVPVPTKREPINPGTISIDMLRDLDVSKIWSDGEEKHVSDSVEIALYANNEVLDTQKINADSNWSYTWKDIHSADAQGVEIKYTVKEAKSIPNYEASYVSDAKGNTVITNTYKPAVQPAKEDKVQTASALIPTGDIANFVYLAIALITIFGLAVLIKSVKNH